MRSGPGRSTCKLSNGPTRVSLKGTVRDPVNLAGADLRLEVQTPDMARLTPLTGVPIPADPALPRHRPAGLRRRRASASPMSRAGSAPATSPAPTPSPPAPAPTSPPTCDSKRVDLADLGGVIGGTPGRAGTPGQTAEQRREIARAAASPRLIPTTPINIPRLQAADIHVRYKADSIRGQGIPFDGLEMALDIVDGVIRLHPGSFKVGRGEISADATLIPQENGTLRAKAEFELRRVDIARLMQAAGAGGAGSLGGVGQIETTGRSLSEMLGNGNGALTVVSVGGNYQRAAGRPLRPGIRLGAAFGARHPGTHEDRMPDRRFRPAPGRLSVRTLLLDTESHVVTGSGVAGLGKEVLDLRLRTDSKHFSIGSLPTHHRHHRQLQVARRSRPELGELGAGPAPRPGSACCSRRWPCCRPSSSASARTASASGWPRCGRESQGGGAAPARR